MALVLAEGVVEVTADATGVGRSVAKDLDGNSGELAKSGERAGGSIFGGIMKSAAVLGGLALTANWLGGSIKGASDLAETSSKAATIFGDNISTVNTWASTAAQTMGLSKAAALDAAAGFGNMFSQLGFSGDEATKMSEKVVQMSADLGSFNNLETGDVADRMSAAFRGEYDSLQALIPNINAARVEQEAMAATGKTNASELTAQEKAAAVLAIVNKDGAAAMGDFAKTADGAANTQKTLTASLDDQQAKVGAVLMPAWQGFLGFLTDTALPAFSTMVDWIGKNTDTLMLLGGVVGVAAAAYFAITTAVGIYTAFTAAQAAATGGMTFAQWALNAALSANPIGLVVIAIAALVAGIIWVATQTTFFQDVFRVMGEVVQNVIKWIGEAFTWLGQNVIAPIAGFIAYHIQTMSLIIRSVGSFISDVFRNVGLAFQYMWVVYVQPIANFITGAFQTISDTVRNIFGGIGDFIGGVFQGLVSVLKGPINTVIGFLNQAIDGANIVGGAFGVNIPHIPYLAKGGMLTRGGTVIVGERGPELLNLPGGASVVPLTSGQRMQGAGGAGQNIDITINESTDPLGTTGRVSAELRKWSNR